MDSAAYEGSNTVWYAAATNLQASGTNTYVVWTNAPADDTPVRFYTAGSDYDQDGDGLSNAREILTYKSSVTNIDTDGDGYVDGWDGVISTNAYTNGVDADIDGFVDGEAEQRTDPTNNDTNAPTVTIAWPTNGHSSIWIP